MNAEKIQNDIADSKFFHMNGTILRTLNVIEDSRCTLSSLEFVFKGHTEHNEFIESVKYLSVSGYINLRNTDTGTSTEFTADKFNDTEMSLSAKGIQVLRGMITDNCINV
ncbi:MAG: hypothetical protein K2F73_06420 [Ruminococcus sp.]|nr:hypothetical protein [Ruminococcus sp.]